MAATTAYAPLSVVLPVFNSYEYLRETLAALKPQLGNHQLIVVNDASTDPRVGELLDRQDWLQAIHLQTNGGSSRARNEGIRAEQVQKALTN